MSLAIVLSRAQLGIAAPLVTVEVHLSNGLPRFTIVGLPETTVRESKDRVRSALINSHFNFPASRITVNLAPADLPKEGGRYDLPIAIGILIASDQVKCPKVDRYEFIGELALNGELRGVTGVLPAIIAAKTSKKAILIAKGNGQEATLVRQARVYAADHLLDVTSHLTGQGQLAAVNTNLPGVVHSTAELADIRGQKRAKRALEVAAAGGHNLLMLGPPGAGKTMLASRLPSILPNLTETQALEVAALKSVIGATFDSGNWSVPPFRSPHHSSSSVALVGGGSQPKPGEISLAHNGILFLDELPEFARNVLDQLREPLESGVIHISRAAGQVTYPACFQLIATMNPCKCGWLGDDRGYCRCTEEQILKYRSRVSGPLMDRIDMHIEVPPVPKEYLFKGGCGEETSTVVRERVIKARETQYRRFGCLNQRLSGIQLERACCIGEEARQLIDSAMENLGLTARAYHRILRVARTIADLSGDVDIQTMHVAEAIGCRLFDRTGDRRII